ncbi:MAG: hypothetical protein WBX01_09750 [Nitrososphaeraceae archaeon]
MNSIDYVALVTRLYIAIIYRHKYSEDLSHHKMDNQGILEICSNYKAKQGMEITPKEYILMLIDSAIGNETK